MRHLGMLPRKAPASFGEPVIAHDSAWVRAPNSGLVVKRAKLGARVKEGQTIAEIADPSGRESTEVRSPHEGIVIGSAQLPLVHEGDAICHIATFDTPSTAAETVAAFTEHHKQFGFS